MFQVALTENYYSVCFGSAHVCSVKFHVNSFSYIFRAKEYSTKFCGERRKASVNCRLNNGHRNKALSTITDKGYKILLSEGLVTETDFGNSTIFMTVKKN